MIVEGRPDWDVMVMERRHRYAKVRGSASEPCLLLNLCEINSIKRLTYRSRGFTRPVVVCREV
jgi:hypothetical protein